jgi:hypothetical protein
MPRPRIDITDEMLQKTEDLASQGLNRDEIARCLGISPTTLYKYKRKDAQFANALKNGRAKGLAVITNALFEKAKAGDTTAMIFYLKNRDPEHWRDRRAFDHVVQGDVVQTVINAQPEITADEWQQKHGKLSGDPSKVHKPH